MCSVGCFAFGVWLRRGRRELMAIGKATEPISDKGCGREGLRVRVVGIMLFVKIAVVCCKMAERYRVYSSASTMC